ncbi:MULTISPECIES: ABC transporter substrate-binding protein [Streptomyces]|uniref:ABC transporter substrate-binding protein n=1 Tax=Streptomyces TaxID=1883 RepID=UPI0034238AE7
MQQQTSDESMFAYIGEKFEKKYPNVEVKFQTVNQKQKVGSNLAVIGSSVPPDVAMIPLNSEVYTQLTNDHMLVPISDVWDEARLKDRYSAPVAASMQTDDGPTTVVYSQLIYNVLWINPILFQRAGVKIPTDHRIKSVDDLIRMAKTFRKAHIAPLQVGGGSEFEASWMLDAFLPTVATKDQMANLLTNHNTKVDVTTPYDKGPFVDAVKAVEKLGKGRVFQDGYLAQDAATALAPFVAGDAAMALYGNFAVPEFQKNKKMDFTPDWLLLPPAGHQSKVVQTQYFGDGLGIPAKSDDIAWAKEFVKFAMSDEMQKDAVVGVGKLLPSVTSLPADQLHVDAWSKSLLADIAANGSAPGWTSVVPGGFGQQFVDPLIQQMLKGDLTPEEVVEKQQDKLTDFRKKS